MYNTLNMVMKKNCVLLALVLSVACAFAGTPLLEGWRFSRGDEVGAESPSFDDSSWEIVRIPHDWAISGHFSETNDIQVTAIEQDGETAKKRHSGRTGGLPWPDLSPRKWFSR